MDVMKIVDCEEPQAVELNVVNTETLASATDACCYRGAI